MLAGYLPATTARGPACPPRARRACWACVGGPWHLVQRIPASVAPLVRSPGVSAPPCPVVWRTTIPWSSHRVSRTRRTCVSRGRGSTARPITSTHGPEDSTSRDTVPARAIPASLHAPHSVSWPHTDNPNPRHDGHERECRPGGAGVAARGPWRLPAIAGTPHGPHFPHLPHLVFRAWLIPPLKDTSSTRPRAARIALWRRRAVRAPVGDAAAPFRRGTGSMDATCASCRLPVGPAGS